MNCKKDEFQGMTALVTGVSRGIGAEVAATVGSRGAFTLIHCQDYGPAIRRVCRRHIRMKCCVFALFALLLVESAVAADLTGKWIATVPRSDGGSDEIVYYLLSQSGSSFTGYVVYGRYFIYQPITEGKVTGTTLTFWVTRDDQKVEYTATITEEGLMIVVPAWGRVDPAFGFGQRSADAAPPSSTQVAKRVSKERPPALPVKKEVPMPKVGVAYNQLAKTPPMGWNSWNRFRKRCQRPRCSRDCRRYGAERNEGRRLRLRQYR